MVRYCSLLRNKLDMINLISIKVLTVVSIEVLDERDRSVRGLARNSAETTVKTIVKTTVKKVWLRGLAETFVAPITYQCYL